MTGDLSIRPIGGCLNDEFQNECRDRVYERDSKNAPRSLVTMRIDIDSEKRDVQ